MRRNQALSALTHQIHYTMQTFKTCFSWQLLFVLTLSVLHYKVATESTPNKPSKLTDRFKLSNDELLVSATVEIVLRYYTTFISKQMYLRWESNNTNTVAGEILERIATHLTVLLESKSSSSNGQRLEPHQQLRVLNLFIVDEYTEFDRIVAGLSDELYDFSGLYTVVLVGTSSERRNLETAGKILRTLWALYIVNVAVLIRPSDGKGSDRADVRLYTYFPYGEGYCELALPVVWNVYQRDVGFIHRTRSPFPPKMQNFYNCPLVVATFPVFPFIIPSMVNVGNQDDALELDGIEGMVLRTLRQRLNFRLQVIFVDPPDWGTAGPRDEATGASAYIRHLRANLSIGYWATTLHRNRYMANSFSYYTSQLVSAVAPGESYTSLELLRCPFAKSIWTLLFVSLTIGLAIIGLLRYKGSVAAQPLILGQSPANAWPGMISVLFGAGLARAPKSNFARILLGYWLAGTLVLRSAYTGSMIRFLQSDRNHTVPDNVPELLSAGYELFMYRNYSFIFDAFPHIGHRVQLVTTQQFRHVIVQQLQNPGARLSVILPLETVTFLNRNLTRDGQLLRITRDRVYVAKLAIYTQKTSSLLGPLNKLLELFVSSGLLNRWAGQYHQLRFLADPYRYRGRQQIVLTNIDGPFAILLVGLALSTFTFVAELLLVAIKGFMN